MDSQTADGFVGKTVQQYAILGKLGGGGMGVVYAARDTRLGRLVALKFLPHQWCHDENAKQRFIREAHAASSTDHPNICTIHDIESTDDGQLFIVMAHYQGQTLKQKLEAGALPVDEALEVAAQVAEGLAKAHAQGVVHRDIKPGNLMMTDDGVRILDFGLAKLANSLQLTMEGSTLGTVAYMSPEQIRGEEADAAADIWAVGVVLYEMLSGSLPFKGAYAEAIGHAIKNDPPPPLRGAGRDIPAELEQVVFRALHKDPRIRFQNARDMARALRRLQGRTIPLDLRTEPLPPLSDLALSPAVRPWWKSRSALGIAAGVVAAIVGVFLWLLSPVDRVSVVVAPVVNQTGYPELDPYRLALTQDLVAELRDSARVRVLPYDRLLQILRRFRESGRDVSSREAIQALTTNSDAQVVVVPTLLYANGGWRARVEFRRADTATNEREPYETSPVVSSLIKDTAYGLMPQLAAAIESHFLEMGSSRAYLTDVVRRFGGQTSRPTAVRLRTLDVAAAFEQGHDAYDQQEYSVALRAFTTASQQDVRSPLLLAWRSRVARLMRHDDEALEAAQQALRLVVEETGALEKLFIEATAAEARRDIGTAEARYRELASRHPDDPGWIIELATFQDRQLRTADAIASYQEALGLDSRLVRPHLELCRLYGPLRLNDPPRAKQQGELALMGYRALGAQAGEAQALWCLIDVLNVGSDRDRSEAAGHANVALRIFEKLNYPYNLSRAFNYAALAASAEGRLADAGSFWERSLEAARNAGNAGLEPAILTNLGVTYEALGRRRRAIEFRQRGYKLFEALGDEQRAAQNQANGAFLLIEYGENPAQGLRDIQNALGVFQKLGDKNFEVFSLRVIAASERNAGRHVDAARELNRALAIAREANIEDEIARNTVELAMSEFDDADYATAQVLLGQALSSRSGPDSAHAPIQLARTETRLGDVATAEMRLHRVAADIQQNAGSEFLPLLELVLGETAYESGYLKEARAHFAEAAALGTDDLPAAASVEARANLGLMDALEGKWASGVTEVRTALEQARRMGRFALESRCRMYAARIEIVRQRFDEAIRILNEIPSDDESRTIGRELRAEVHHWRAQALAGRGDSAGARSERAGVQKLLADIEQTLPERYRPMFAARPGIRLLR